MVVLIADDSAAIRIRLAGLLQARDLPASILKAEEARQAIEMIDRGHPDVLILGGKVIDFIEAQWLEGCR
jgi:chemotaxis response regulator CheB